MFLSPVDSVFLNEGWRMLSQLFCVCVYTCGKIDWLGTSSSYKVRFDVLCDASIKGFVLHFCCVAIHMFTDLSVWVCCWGLLFIVLLNKPKSVIHIIYT